MIGCIGHDGDCCKDREELERDAARYRLVRRGQHWSVVNGIGDSLRGDALDVAVDAVMSAKTATGEIA